MLKKLIRNILISLAFTAGITATAHAEEALCTDISVYINHYPINSYGINGKMAVVAEDLRDYGFSVVWDGNSRQLHISRDTSVIEPVRRDIYKLPQPSGTKFSDIYPTDITADYNGIPIESYALNGYTLVAVNDIAALAGSDSYDDAAREYKIWIDGMHICDYRPVEPRTKCLFYSPYNGIRGSSVFYEDMNCDGIKEKLSLEYYYFDDVTDLYCYAGDDLKHGKISQFYAFSLAACYVTDLVPNDGSKEFVIFGNSEDTSVILAICRYQNGRMVPLDFEFYRNGLETRNYIPFRSGSCCFTANDDGSFTTDGETDYVGSWVLYKTFRPNEYGHYVQDYQEVYTANTLAPHLFSNRFDQWGYTWVDRTVTGRGFDLYAGDYIRALEENSDGYVHLQKSTGEHGWFRLYVRDSSLVDSSMLFYRT